MSLIENIIREIVKENIDKKYTHFLVDKLTDKIVDGWDYSKIDNDEIKHYTKLDIADNFPERKANEFKLLTKISLEKKGINPFDPKNWGNINESIKEGYNEETYYMFFQNIEQIKNQCDELLMIDKSTIDSILKNGHDWAADHVSTSKDDIEEVYNFITSKLKSGNSSNLE